MWTGSGRGVVRGAREDGERRSTGRRAQTREGAGLELAHALARETEVAADLLERVLRLFAETEAPAQDLLLARRQTGERVAHGDLELATLDASIGIHFCRVREHVAV